MRHGAPLAGAVLLVVASISSCGSCGEDRHPGGTAPHPVAAEPAGSDPRAGLEVHLDLLDSAQLADVRHHGLYLDLGTPAGLKYIGGRWQTGWGSDRNEGG